MAKTKNKRKNLAEHTSDKRRQQTKKTLNPFEVHINREKMKVLGRKLKNDRGLPGVSRAKALKKRKSTLLQEFKLQNKTNRFVDKRIGERNVGLNEDDRAMARFAAVRARAHKKSSIFNLADDEVLTHRGQTLSEIERFDDPRSDDEDSLDGQTASGKLDADFVEDAHFGGGVLSRTGMEGVKSHKDLINQLIAESKRRKAEKQKSKEQTLELTEKLDTEWRDLIPIVNKSLKQPNEATRADVDDYDKVIKELKFEARGNPSDRLKSEDELAKEEKEKLEKLENERLTRMKGFVEEKVAASAKHRSADDLDDDFAYESDEEVMLSYNKEGESNITIPNQETIEEVANDDDENEESSDEDVETASEDDLSDLKESNSDSEVEDGINEQLMNKNIKADFLKRKEVMEKARQELPYTFTVPDSYEALQKLFMDQPPEHHSIIIERIIKCYHPSLNSSNKEKLGLLFVYLLQHISDSTDSDDVTQCFKMLHALMPQLFDLGQLNQESAHHSMVEVIKEKHTEYKKNKKIYPTMDVLLFLKIVSCLFPTSDFRHNIVTPCIVFIDQMLHKCKNQTRKDIAYGLFLVTLILEYTSLSKRYLPSAIGYLSGILHMAIPKTGVKLVKVLPPFRSTSNILVLRKNCSTLEEPFKLRVSDLACDEVSEDFKVRAMHASLGLLQEFADNFKGLTCRCEIFQIAASYLQQIPLDNYPSTVQNKITGLLQLLKKFETEQKLTYIVMQASKPKALRLYEPNIQKVFDTKKQRPMSKEKAEREKLLHKLKREKKGALREIRRDKEFLGRVKIKQRIQSDKERQEKVKRIFSEAAIQQSELNSLDRKKKRKK